MRGLREKYRYSWVLLKELVKTEFKLRYQNSALGYAWSILRPLFIFAIMYVVFAYIFKAGDGIEHYPVYLLLGMVLWNFFTETVSNGLQSVVSRGDILRKINFPRYVIVLASGFQAFITMIFSLIVVVVLAIVTGVEWQFSALLVPLFILEVFVFANACSFILAVLYVKTKDVKYIWEVVQQVMFYATPIVYSIGIVSSQWPMLAKLMMLNPVADAMQSARWAAVTHGAETMSAMTSSVLMQLAPWIICGVFSLIAYRLYKKNVPDFAEKA